MTPIQNIIAIGLPMTGKTTYLAALWDVVGSGEVVGSLQLTELTGDRHHLNEIRNKWADFHELPRTYLKDEGVVSMRLRDSGTGATHDLDFADMSGESCEKQWNDRICTEKYLNLIQGATGVLLFIHPNRIKEDVLIRDAKRLMRRLPKPNSEVADGAAPQPSVATAAPLPAVPHYAATQVQLVELLQVIEFHSQRQPPFRIGVLISAFDTLAKDNPLPKKWVEKSLPLLHQYLQSNPELFEVEYFGVSAQGGDLKDAAELRKKNIRASDRITVVRGKTESHDISEPVRWVLGLKN